MIFVRITYRGQDGKRRSVILGDPADRNLGALGPVVVGVEVDRNGDVREVDPGRFEREGVTTTRTCIIGADVIVRRTTLVEDLHYGGLVTPAKARASARRAEAIRRGADR